MRNPFPARPPLPPSQGLGLMGLGAFGAHPALLGGHPYGDLGLPGMGHMGMPGGAGAQAASCAWVCDRLRRA